MDDILIFRLIEKFSLNKYNQAIVQIFTIHFVPLLILHKIHRKNTLSPLAVATGRISTNLIRL
jgi:hypothetical protein